jgi:hypothetical protein
LAWQSLDKARVEVGHANRRLDEIEEMAGRDEPQYLAGLLERYNAHIDTAAGLAAEAAADGKDTTEIDTLIASTRTRHDEILASLRENAPDDVREALGEDTGETPGSDMMAPEPAAGSGPASGDSESGGTEDMHAPAGNGDGGPSGNSGSQGGGRGDNDGDSGADNGQDESDGSSPSRGSQMDGDQGDPNRKAIISDSPSGSASSGPASGERGSH